MKLNLPQASINQDNTLENPVYIVNLSTIHGLLSVSEVLDNFAQLHYNYAKSWLPFAWLKYKYSQTWVAYKYLSMMGSMKDYNLGKIDTDAFIGQLQAIFYFLPPEKSAELLKETWNSLIILDPSAKNLKYLINQEAVICFISNTNELHAQKIEHYVNETIREMQKQSIKTIYFLSFEKGQLKLEGLFEKTVNELENRGYPCKNMLLISQYPSDLNKAKELGIKCVLASEFYPTTLVVIATPVIQPIRVASNSDRASPKIQARPFFVEKPEENQTCSETSPLLTNQGP